MNKLCVKDIRRVVKMLEESRVTKPYYIEVEKPSELYDLLKNHNKGKKVIDKVKVK